MTQKRPSPLKGLPRAFLIPAAVLGVLYGLQWFLFTVLAPHGLRFLARNDLYSSQVPQIPFERSAWERGSPNGEDFKFRVAMTKSVLSRFAIGTSMGTVLTDLGNPDSVSSAVDWSKTQTKNAPKGANLAIGYVNSRSYSWIPSHIWFCFSESDRLLGVFESEFDPN